jgi:hypothetical protein
MTQPEIRYGLEIPNDKSVEELIRQTKEKPPACWNAYTALGNNITEKSIYALNDLLINPDWTHVRSAIEAIGNNIRGIHLEDKLLAFLDNNNKFVLTATIKALSNLKSTKAHDKIKKLINRDNVEIKQAAIGGLSNIWQIPDFDFLVDCYNQQDNDTIKKAIGFVLAEHVDKYNWKRFFDTFSNDPVTRHRQWALDFAIEFSSDEKLIDRFLTDEDGHILKKAQRFKEAIKNT